MGRMSWSGCIVLTLLSCVVPLAAGEAEEALIAAASAGKAKDVARLLDSGVDANALSGADRWSALSLAAENGHMDCVRLLVERGARMDQVVNQDLTALQRAVTARQLDVVRYLVEHGADVRVRARGGRTLLIDATDSLFSNRESHAVGIVITLLACGIDIDASDESGYTALMHAVREGQGAVAQMLIRLGANPDARGKDGKTVLDLAREKNLESILELLEGRKPHAS